MSKAAFQATQGHFSQISVHRHLTSVSSQWGWAQKDPSHRFATGPRKRSCALFRPFGFPCRQGSSRLLPAQPTAGNGGLIPLRNRKCLYAGKRSKEPVHHSSPEALLWHIGAQSPCHYGVVPVWRDSGKIALRGLGCGFWKFARTASPAESRPFTVSDDGTVKWY